MAPLTFDKAISEGSSKKSHAFPALRDETLRTSGGPQDNRNLFKPLFNNAFLCEAFAPQEGFGASQTDNIHDPEDQIRQKGFEHGFDAGKRDACRMARQELMPEIRTFAVELSQLSENLTRIEENSCRQILKMALSITEKILSTELDLRAEALDSLKGELKNHMVKFYQLKLILNPEDLVTLNEFLGCDDPRLQKCHYIRMEGDAQVKQGALLVQPGAEPVSSDGTLIQTLEKTLERVSTK